MNLTTTMTESWRDHHHITEVKKCSLSTTTLRPPEDTTPDLHLYLRDLHL